MVADSRKVIALTGGGTAGHVMPHLAIIPYLEDRGWEVFYIGSKGVEKSLIAKTNVEYFEVAAGKLRRYFSFQNFLDIFKVSLGLLQSILIVGRKKPSIVFSKGGFVSVPVAVAAWLFKIPVVSHESDLSPGLANRIISKFATKILLSFPESSSLGPRSVLTGLPIRASLFGGDRLKGLDYLGLDGSKPVILIMGGSLGAQKINNLVANNIDRLLEVFHIVHVTGAGKELDLVRSGYVQFSFIADIEHLFAAADCVISRSGANSIFEFLALQLPMLLIPLESGSRGDQVENALCFASQGWAKVARESELTDESFVLAALSLYNDREVISSKQAAFAAGSCSIDKVICELESCLKIGKQA